MADAFKIGVEMFEDLSIESFLQELDWLNRSNALALALRRASEVVQQNAIPRISRSSVTGTAKKKSRQQQRADQRRKPLADSVEVVVRRYADDTVFLAVTGQKLEPDQIGKGKKSVVAHSHLLELGHRAVFWGRSNWEYRKEQEVGGFRFKQRSDGTRRSDERLIRTKTVAVNVGGSTRADFVKAKRWLAPAVDSTKAQQQDAIFGVLKAAAMRAYRKRNKKTVIKKA